MPTYLFERVDDPTKTADVVFGMNDNKVYNGPDGKEIGRWRRVWSTRPPGAAHDMQIDPWSAKDFAKATNKKGVIGDLWERSAEMSERRAEKEGNDPVKQGFYKRYAKTHAGTAHPQQIREHGVDQLKKVGINLDWGDRA